MKTNWQTKKLGEVVQIQNGFAFKSSEYIDAGYFVMRITNVQDGVIELNDPKYIKESGKSFGGFILHEDDILMSLTGNVGRIGVVKKEHLPAVLNQRVARLKAYDINQLDRDFLYYFLRSPEFFGEVVGGGKGMAQQNISTKDIENLEIPLPPLEEQKRIVAILDEKMEKIREAKRLRQEALADTDRILPQTLREIFEEGKQKSWEERLLGAVCDLQNGFAFKSSDYVEYSNTLNIRMSNIRPGGVFDPEHSTKYLPDIYSEKYSEFLLTEGDLIIAMTDMASEPKILGVPTLVKHLNSRKFLMNQRVGRLRDFANGVAVPYVRYMLTSEKAKDFYKSKGGGGLQINISKGDILSFPVIMPSLPEQQQIINRLDELSERVRQLRKLQQSQLDDLNRLERALLREAFGGEL
jgi:restriction endonuclease S subunit